MITNEENEPQPFASKLFLIGLSLIFIGIVLVGIGGMLSNASGASGTIVIIGPIPIIFGKGENISSIILIAVLLTIACMIFFLLAQRRRQIEA
jgi:uncharacterized membrane protein